MTEEVLLVEDDPDDAELFRFAARDAGLRYPIRVAHNGGEALDLLLNQRLSPVVILLDLKMPGIGGMEVLRRLREHPVMRDIVVFVLTSSDLERDQAEAQRLGCNLYLVKPATYADYVQMAKKIKSLLP